MTEMTVCDLCGEATEFEYFAEEKFVYGAEADRANLTATVLVRECSTCGDAWTGEHGEIQRTLAVNRHLASISANEAP
jgi:hypothetical protein